MLRKTRRMQKEVSLALLRAGVVDVNHSRPLHLELGGFANTKLVARTIPASDQTANGTPSQSSANTTASTSFISWDGAWVVTIVDGRMTKEPCVDEELSKGAAAAWPAPQARTDAMESLLEESSSDEGSIVLKRKANGIFNSSSDDDLQANSAGVGRSASERGTTPSATRTHRPAAPPPRAQSRGSLRSARDELLGRASGGTPGGHKEELKRQRERKQQTREERRERSERRKREQLQYLKASGAVRLKSTVKRKSKVGFGRVKLMQQLNVRCQALGSKVGRFLRMRNFSFNNRQSKPIVETPDVDDIRLEYVCLLCGEHAFQNGACAVGLLPRWSSSSMARSYS